jgi:hypothetical protein
MGTRGKHLEARRPRGSVDQKVVTKPSGTNGEGVGYARKMLDIFFINRIYVLRKL